MSVDLGQLQARRTGSGRRSTCDSDTSETGQIWYRKGGAICSLAVLLLGSALLLYGIALMTIGHKPLPEGQAEQFTRIARIRLHQYQQLNSPQDDSIPDGANVSNLTEFELPPDPHAQHLAMMVKQAFESVISSEELPRPRSQTGSLQEHQLRSTDTNDLVTAEPNTSMSRNAARKLLQCAPLNHVVNGLLSE